MEMPSPSVIAKNDLVRFLRSLTERLGGKGKGLNALPSCAEWDQVTDLARIALKRKGLAAENTVLLNWSELARLEKAYRSGQRLEFKPIFERFVEVLENECDSFSHLQKNHWSLLAKERAMDWGGRSVTSQTIDWLINEVRPSPEFDVRPLKANPATSLPDYGSLHKINCFNLTNVGDLLIEAGKLLQNEPCFSGGGSTIAIRTASEGYHVVCGFFEKHRQWLAYNLEDLNNRDGAAFRIFQLGNTWFENRLVKLRYAFFGAPSYRQKQVSTPDLMSNGQVTNLGGLAALKTKVADAERKRAKNGGRVRLKKLYVPIVLKNRVRSLDKSRNSPGESSMK